MSRFVKGIVAGGIVGAIAWAIREHTEAESRKDVPQVIPAASRAPERPSKAREAVKGFLGDLLGDLLDDTAPTRTPTPAIPTTRTPTRPSGTTQPPSSGQRDLGPGGVDFAAYERRYGLPKGYLRTTAKIESSLNPNAKNPRSSAGGLFQFIDATARDYGLRNRFDPVQATDAASRLARDNKKILRPTLGRDPTGGELYLAHQQGGGGARKLLRQPRAKAVDVVGSAQVRLNGGSSSMTAQQFANLWINKFKRFS